MLLLQESVKWQDGNTMSPLMFRKKCYNHSYLGRITLPFHIKENGKVIGSVGLHESWANGDSEYSHLKMKNVGFVLSKDYWGKGLMPEAVAAVIRFCFDECNLDALTCGHSPTNSQSKRVIEKCGFSYVKQSEYFDEQLQMTFNGMRYILFR